MEKKKYFTVYRMAVVGLMSALVFACTFIHIDVPVPMSNKVMIHFGNIMSLLAALLFGPVTGGLSAGLGSAIYDLTDPVYAPEAWITFLMKFAMAWAAGMIAHSGKAHGEKKGKNILAAVCGAGTYVFLYGCKTVVMQRFVMGAVWQAGGHQQMQRFSFQCCAGFGVLGSPHGAAAPPPDPGRCV